MALNLGLVGRERLDGHLECVQARSRHNTGRQHIPNWDSSWKERALVDVHSAVRLDELPAVTLSGRMSAGGWQVWYQTRYWHCN